MPIYEYFCPECNYKFELLRSISKGKEKASCPQCQHAAKRILSRFTSFSKGTEGEPTPIAGTASPCSSCTATSCDSCYL
ncbi:MAG TPA: zinc ribbon domain-containing protein [Dehalococcoidia bacterium]|nr:zinc ribbon domain-containing protein [Dehalococcoidia bacterium]